MAMTQPDPQQSGGGQSGRRDDRTTGAQGRIYLGGTRPRTAGSRPGERGAQPGTTPPGPGGAQPAAFGWSVFSYMVGGMILYGGAGWLIGRWTHLPVLFPVGMIVGLALSIALIIFRVTRS
jgi:ATP synthase protein I